MMASSSLLTHGFDLVQLIHPKLPSYWTQRHHGIRSHSVHSFTCVTLPILRGRIQYNHPKHVGGKHIVSVGVARNGSTIDDELPVEPFWLSLIRDVIWGLGSLFSFLVEQPSQLKYIEWPSFKSTLKTATLSLILVAVFIVALSTVDSALCYVLALVLRKTP